VGHPGQRFPIDKRIVMDNVKKRISGSTLFLLFLTSVIVAFVVAMIINHH
jgi:hypothetical protein